MHKTSNSGIVVFSCIELSSLRNKQVDVCMYVVVKRDNSTGEKLKKRLILFDQKTRKNLQVKIIKASSPSV